MGDVRKLAGVAQVDHVEMVAAGLERLAADLRAGLFPVSVRRCAVIVNGPAEDTEDGVGLMWYGAAARTPELIGILEMAKIEAMEAARA